MDETSDDHGHHTGYFDLPPEERARREAEAAEAAAKKGRGARKGAPRAKAVPPIATPGEPQIDEGAEGGPNQRNLLIAGALAVLLLIGGVVYLVTGGDDEDVATGATTTTVAGDAATTTAPGAPAATTSSIQIDLAAGKAVLSGKVRSDEIRQLVVGGSVMLFQTAGEVVDELTVDPTAAEINPYDDALLKCLGEPALQGIGAQGIKLAYDDQGRIVVDGTVSSQAAHDRIIGAVAGLAGGLDRVDDKVKVVEPATTTTEAGDPSGPPTTKAPEVVQQDLDALLSGKVVEFDTGSAELNNQWAATVDEVAGILKGGSAKVQIAGHTDNEGDPAENLALSRRRAETIRDALVARGVAADRLTIEGYGQDRPVADNATDEGRQRNRRIEFVVAAR